MAHALKRSGSGESMETGLQKVNITTMRDDRCWSYFVESVCFEKMYVKYSAWHGMRHWHRLHVVRASRNLSTRRAVYVIPYFSLERRQCLRFLCLCAQSRTLCEHLWTLFNPPCQHLPAICSHESSLTAAWKQPTETGNPRHTHTHTNTGALSANAITHHPAQTQPRSHSFCHHKRCRTTSLLWYDFLLSKDPGVGWGLGCWDCRIQDPRVYSTDKCWDPKFFKTACFRTVEKWI